MTMVISNWKTARLRDIAIIDRVLVQPENIANDTLYVGLEHIDSFGRFLTPPNVASGDLASTKFEFSPEHILYGKLRPYLSKIARPNFSGICSTDILPLKPGPDIDKDFLYHFLRHPRMIDLATTRSAGANLPRLSPETLADFLVPIPPMPQQKKIAATVEISRNVLMSQETFLRKTVALLKSSYLQNFGDPIFNERNWKTITVADICDLVRGSSPRPQGDSRYYGGNVPRLMVADLTRDGWWVTPRIDSLTEEGAKLSRPVQAGTIVMAVSGNVGICARLSIDACIHDGFVGLTNLNTNKIDPNFLMVCLDLLRQTHDSRRAGAIFQNLTTHDVKAIEIPLPPMKEQLRFASIFEHVQRSSALFSQSSRLAQKLFDSLIHQQFANYPWSP